MDSDLKKELEDCYKENFESDKLLNKEWEITDADIDTIEEDDLKEKDTE